MGGSKNGVFNPFTDRLSRDLRNDLSEALLAALTGGAHAAFLAVAAAYRQHPELGPGARGYLEDRLACYQAVLAETNRDLPDQQALLLWNHELFFEFHELLEKRWRVAEGVARKVLQALIRAAGTYVLRHADRREGAVKMAARAIAIIKRHQDELPPGFETKRLLVALADPLAPPPQFGILPPTGYRCRHSARPAKNQRT